MELAKNKGGAVLAALALATMIAAGTAHASPQVLGAAVGGGLGAAVGNQVGGAGGAIVGGAVGAAAGAALTSPHPYGYRAAPPAYAPPVHVVPAPVYGAAVPMYQAPVYMAPPPMVARRAPVYVMPATVYGPPPGHYAPRGWQGRKWKHWKHHHHGHGHGHGHW